MGESCGGSGFCVFFSPVSWGTQGSNEKEIPDVMTSLLDKKEIGENEFEVDCKWLDFKWWENKKKENNERKTPSTRCTIHSRCFYYCVDE